MLHSGMPTNRPRHLITETDEVAAALDAASRRWPAAAASRSRLMVNLVLEGHQRLREADESILEQRLEAILETQGSLAGCFPQGYLEALREDWPA